MIDVYDSRLFPRISESWAPSGQSLTNGVVSTRVSYMSEEEKVEAKTPWETSVNAGKLEDFAGELGKDLPSKGTFAEDYAHLAGELVPCPFFVTPTESSVRVANVAVDLPSWRAMLLSISTAGSVVKELTCHGCTLTAQHIADLVATLEKMGVIEVLKLDYMTLKLGDEEDIATTILPLLSSEKAIISYLSLKGCNLGDDFVCAEGFYKNMSENVALKTLNLANNQFTDVGMSSIIRALKVNPAIKELSLAQNTCQGECLTDLAGMIVGAEVSEEEDGVWKAVAKHVGEKNKAVGAANKGRKKKGYHDLPECATPAERLVKVDDVNYIANRTLKTLDLSFCPLTGEAFEKSMRILQGEHKSSEPALDLTILVRGRSADLVVPPPLPSEEASGGEAKADAADSASIEGLKLCY